MLRRNALTPEQAVQRPGPYFAIMALASQVKPDLKTPPVAGRPVKEHVNAEAQRHGRWESARWDHKGAI